MSLYSRTLLPTSMAAFAVLFYVVSISGAGAQVPSVGYAEIAELKTYDLGDIPTGGGLVLDYLEDDETHLAARDAFAESLQPNGFNILEEAPWRLAFEFGVDLAQRGAGDGIASSTPDLTGEDIEETMGDSLLTRDAACDPPRYFLEAQLREGSNAPAWTGRISITAIGCEREELAARMARELTKYIGQEVDIHGGTLP